MITKECILLFVVVGATTLPLEAHSAPLFNANIIINGDAEADLGASNDFTTVPPSGFTPTGNLSAVKYGASGGFPTSSSPGPVDRGLNFFTGGPNIAFSGGLQFIDLSSGASSIDLGTIDFNLSGFLGGFLGQSDNAIVSLQFLDSSNSVLGSSSIIGPVSNTERKNITGLLFRETTGKVPIGSRAARIQLDLTRIDGTYNDGYADNLSLVLNNSVPNPNPVPGPLPILGVGAAFSWSRKLRKRIKSSLVKPAS